MAHNISAAVMYPKPAQQPRMPILIGGYVDKVLQRAATAGDGWLTYFYSPEIIPNHGQNPQLRQRRRQGSRQADECLAAADHDRKIKSGDPDEMLDWLNKEWDFPENSDCSREIRRLWVPRMNVSINSRFISMPASRRSSSFHTGTKWIRSN